jgi:hypothetical protein
VSTKFVQIKALGFKLAPLRGPIYRWATSGPSWPSCFLIASPCLSLLTSYTYFKEFFHWLLYWGAFNWQQVKVQEEIEQSSEEQTEIVNKTESFGQTKAVSQTGNVGQTKAVNQTGAVSQTNINSNAGTVQQNGAITKHEGTEKQQENMVCRTILLQNLFFIF